MDVTARSMRARVEAYTDSITQKVNSMRLRAGVELIKLVYGSDYADTSYFLEDYTEKTFLEE